MAGGQVARPTDVEDFRMGSFSWIHWVIVIGVAMLLFGGRGKISELMGDFAKGIKAFKKGMSDDDKADTEPAKDAPVKIIDHNPAAGATTNASSDLKHRSDTEKRFEGGTV
jgi:sec-independent protein translocase protein TatA